MAVGVEPSLLRAFVSYTERKVSPKQVGRLYQRAEMLAKLPLAVQQWITRHAGGDPSIGFVVEPYCLFLAYEISDATRARQQLPPGYELVPTAMFADTEPRYSAIIGAFNVHSSVFWGSRVELYVIAENRETGLLSWVICDYESNTISYDPGQGFSAASTSRAVITTSHAGEVIIDVRSQEGQNRLTLSVPLTDAKTRGLDQRLWVEGNLSVDYGGRLMDADAAPFGLVFDPAEMSTALQVPSRSVDMQQNTFGAGWLAPDPFEVACFPYAQHFITTSYPRESRITDRSALEQAVRELGAAAESA